MVILIKFELRFNEPLSSTEVVEASLTEFNLQEWKAKFDMQEKETNYFTCADDQFPSIVARLEREIIRVLNKEMNICLKEKLAMPRQFCLPSAIVPYYYGDRNNALFKRWLKFEQDAIREICSTNSNLKCLQFNDTYPSFSFDYISGTHMISFASLL